MSTLSTGTINATGLATIIYVDNYGETTERTIKPLRTYTGRNGYTYIEAYCYLRGEKRTFRKDHILNWTRQYSSPHTPKPVNPPAITPVWNIQSTAPPTGNHISHCFDAYSEHAEADNDT